ncbi:MAG: hypothetical protein GVY10_04245 [Verrucomicrobia bacterium]|nr:hypothetical protein [Verrucomicrobiota bacterium]
MNRSARAPSAIRRSRTAPSCRFSGHGCRAGWRRSWTGSCRSVSPFPERGASSCATRRTGRSCCLRARIQQLYDVPGKSLTVGDGRLSLRLEILAPNQRPVHITDDLDGFWEGAYPQIRKDLFGRYPKHEWR